MKKKIALLAAAAMLVFSVAFSQENKTTPEKIVRVFNQDFSNASNIDWSITGNYYKAIFSEDGERKTAFYSQDGQLNAVSRKLTTQQLPMALMKDIKKMQANYTITDLFELNSNRGTEYYITYSNGKDSKTFYSTGESWSTYDNVQS